MATQTDLGLVTAYGYAKAGGYTGSVQQFQQMLANLPSYATRAEAGATTATQQATVATNAADRAEQIVGGQFVSYGGVQGLSDTQKAQARANIGAASVNPNLLINGWFNVNQRNATSYTQEANTYNSVDRWRWLGGSTGQMTVNNPYGITLQQTNASAGNLWIIQFAEKSSEYYGKQVTFSVDADGTIYSSTVTIPASVPSAETNITTRALGSGAYLRVTLQPSGSIRVGLYVTDTDPHTFNAVKMELGTASTLAYDAPPDYGEELARCQRFFQRIYFPASRPICEGWAWNSDYVRSRLDLATPMRVYPTLPASSGGFRLAGNSTTLTPTNVTLAGQSASEAPNKDIPKVWLSISGASPTANQLYTLYSTTAGYIDLIAEINS